MDARKGLGLRRDNPDQLVPVNPGDSQQYCREALGHTVCSTQPTCLKQPTSSPTACAGGVTFSWGGRQDCT